VTGLAQIVVRTDLVERVLPIFRNLAEGGISVDLINVSPEAKSFCVEERKAGQAEAILRDLGLEPVVRRGCAKVSVVGSGMRGRPGVMATVAEALSGAGVEILQTADSHVTISCLLEATYLQAAVQALHDAFGLGHRETA
jgi:aspartate kinase